MPVPTLTAPELRSFRAALLKWYGKNRRDLPWRETKDPYRIWVSEIMLQQTRVAAVVEKYREFLERFPNVNALAAADLAEVLAVWSGLGYYRRARALHQAAKVVLTEHAGQLPADLASLRSLKGIGRYTGAAIASIAFGIPAAVVDGNVERVLTRVTGRQLKGEDAWSSAERFLSTARPGDWNQAMMELGATICTPASPECRLCPVRKWCAAPGIRVLQQDPPRRKATLVYGLARRNGSIFLVQRAATESLMAGMWELPQLDSAVEAIAFRMKHSITVNDYDVHVVLCAKPKNRRGKWVKIAEASTLPLTGLARKILRRANLLAWL